MKKLLQILTFVVCLVAQNSCTTTKRVSRSSTVKTDSVISAKTDTFHYHSDTTVITRTDTVIVEKVVAVHDTLNADDLAPVTTVSGKTVPHVYSKDSGRLHIKVTVLPDGRAVIDGWVDSTQTVITNRESILSKSTDTTRHASTSTTAERSYTADSYFESIKKVRVIWWVYAVVIFVVICIIVELFIKLKAKFFGK